MSSSSSNIFQNFQSLTNQITTLATANRDKLQRLTNNNNNNILGRLTTIYQYINDKVREIAGLRGEITNLQAGNGSPEEIARLQQQLTNYENQIETFMPELQAYYNFLTNLNNVPVEQLDGIESQIQQIEKLLEINQPVTSSSASSSSSTSRSRSNSSTRSNP